MPEQNAFSLDVVVALGVTLLFFCASWFQQERWRDLAFGVLFVIAYFTSWYSVLTKDFGRSQSAESKRSGSVVTLLQPDL